MHDLFGHIITLIMSLGCCCFSFGVVLHDLSTDACGTLEDCELLFAQSLEAFLHCLHQTLLCDLISVQQTKGCV